MLKRLLPTMAFLCLFAATLPQIALADEIVLTNGIRLRGKIVKETAESVTIEAKMGRRTRSMTWPLKKVRSITIDGERRVLNEGGARTRRARPKPEESEEKISETGAERKESQAEETESARPKRTKSEVDALIKEAGRTPPDWWDSVELKYPRTLRMDWPQPRKGEKWTPSKYPGQYVISVINPNQSRWREGARLFHHMLTVNKSNRSALAKTMDRLGHIYGNLLGDYPRAAFWWRAAEKTGMATAHVTLCLANCYWQLGSKDLAKGRLRRISGANTTVIKLWSEMGDLNKALSLAKTAARGRFPQGAWFAAGNACRSHERYDDAIEYYEKIVAMRATGKRAEGINRFKRRAREAIQTIKVFEALDLSKIADGAYRGSADAFRGNLEVEVNVQSGRIESVRVTQHKEDWFYTSLTTIPARIVEAQGLKGVDAVTGATYTSVAIVNAAANALGRAMR